MNSYLHIIKKLFKYVSLIDHFIGTGEQASQLCPWFVPGWQYFFFCLMFELSTHVDETGDIEDVNSIHINTGG